jgi:hypothetical protein
MGLIDDAIARTDARPVKRIDYARMKRVRRGQKAALTRAVNTGDAEKIAAVCKAAVAEWNEIGAWPDDWSRWQRALSDALPWNRHVGLEDL